MPLAIVVIGRNEADHLDGSLASAQHECERVVYVDSASSDESPAVAKRRGVAVVELPNTPPMSAARGRNAGREFVRHHWPEVRYVQFVDGDTELVAGWCARACRYLDEHLDAAVVAGRLHEKDARRNAFHRLADMEFDTETGDVDAVGGIAMYRLAPFDAAGGFNPHVVSGEERELHVRIRQLGFRIVRLQDSMAHHDIDMNRVSQWWVRTMRSGQTYAEHWLDRGLMGRRLASIVVWGGVLPTAAFGMALPTLGLSYALLAPHALLYRRIRRERLMRGSSPEDATLYAFATVVGKVPELAGVARLFWRRAFGT